MVYLGQTPLLNKVKSDGNSLKLSDLACYIEKVVTNVNLAMEENAILESVESDNEANLEPNVTNRVKETYLVNKEAHTIIETHKLPEAAADNLTDRNSKIPLRENVSLRNYITTS